MKYVDTDKLVKSINNYQEGAKAALNPTDGDTDYYKGKIDTCKDIQEFITSLQQEQTESSNNLVDVDTVREDFIMEVYRVLDADPTNDRANAIIYAFDSLPTVTQEQSDLDLEKEIDEHVEGMPMSEFTHESEVDIHYDWARKEFRYFYELGQREMRHRITNPEYNAKVIEQLKSEYPTIKIKEE